MTEEGPDDLPPIHTPSVGHDDLILALKSLQASDEHRHRKLSSSEPVDLHPALKASLEYLGADNFSTNMVNVDLDANECHFNDADRKAEIGIPKDVYLGRRGSYMIAPGLESFQTMNGLDNEQGEGNNENVENDSISALMKTKRTKNAVALEEYKTVNEEIKAPGLICVMHTNGFNVAHQGGINDAG